MRAEASDRHMCGNGSIVQIRPKWDDIDSRKRSGKQRHQPRLDLQTNLWDAGAKILDHAGIDDLMAQALLAPHQERSVERSSSPLRLRITARCRHAHSVALFEQRPALGKPAQRKI